MGRDTGTMKDLMLCQKRVERLEEAIEEMRWAAYDGMEGISDPETMCGEVFRMASQIRDWDDDAP